MTKINDMWNMISFGFYHKCSYSQTVGVGIDCGLTKLIPVSLRLPVKFATRICYNTPGHPDIEGILPKGPYQPCVACRVGPFWQDIIDMCQKRKCHCIWKAVEWWWKHSRSILPVWHEKLHLELESTRRIWPWRHYSAQFVVSPF